MPESPIILFGAFDRHNLGDILLAWVAAAELARRPSPRPVILAGLAERDLGSAGGFKVRAIADLARQWGDRPADVLHVGGELLTCDLFQAAVMLQGAAADAAMARYAADPAAGMAWARRVLGLKQNMGYLVPKSLFANPGLFEYRAVGGVDLAGIRPEWRAEVLDRLGEADALSVRDAVTRAHLAASGIDAALAPDPVSRAPDLFPERIRAHALSGEPAAVRAAMRAAHPRGYLTMQFAAEYGDDASLDAIARHMDALLADTGLGLVLFRAGAAPWHDDLGVYRRLAARLDPAAIHLFQSLDVWDICALLAGASRHCGTSLHGWILSRALGVETTPFPLPLHQAKLAAYQDTWATTRPMA
jgi:hypothetical protein